MDIKVIATTQEVLDEIMLNGDQTMIKYIPVPNWKMVTEGSKDRIDWTGQ